MICFQSDRTVWLVIKLIGSGRWLIRIRNGSGSCSNDSVLLSVCYQSRYLFTVLINVHWTAVCSINWCSHWVVMCNFSGWISFQNVNWFIKSTFGIFHKFKTIASSILSDRTSSIWTTCYQLTTFTRSLGLAAWRVLEKKYNRQWCPLRGPEKKITGSEICSHVTK